jgi:DNA-binding Xre family transcriptional regulator
MAETTQTLEAMQMGTIRVMVPQLMAENDMNITDLAEAMGVSWPTAQKMASGRHVPSGEYLVKLCEIFNVDPGEILVYRPEDEGAG